MALAVAAVAAALLMTPLLSITSRARLDLAAAEIGTVLRLARSEAIKRHHNVALKFRTRPNGVVTFTMYRDGDGDGVRNADIDAAIDPQLAAPRELAHLGATVRFGFPPGVEPRDPGDPRRRLDRLDDPIRFNRSDLASFGALGTSTPGSVYLTDGRAGLVVVRLFGRTGKVTVRRYDVESETWS